MFDYDPNVCDRCQARKDDIGMGGCFCPSEEAVVTTTPRIISASEWKAARALRVESEAAAKRAEKLAAQARDERIAKEAFGRFMVSIADGKDPWPSHGRLPVISDATREVADLIEGMLRSATFVVSVEHPTYDGPGGRGQMSQVYVDEKTWTVYVDRPR